MESPGKLGLRVRQRNAGPQAAHHIGPIEVRIDEHRVVLVAIIPGERGTVHDRDVEHRRRAWGDSEEFGCGDSRDRKWDVIDADGLANGRRISGEPAAPVVITENRHLRSPGKVIVIADEPARSRNDSEAAEEVPGDKFDVRRVRLAR